MTRQTESSGRGSDGSDIVRAEPAVVYFAKAPVPGTVKTRLCPPLTPEEAAALYGAFLHQVVQPIPGARTLVYGWPRERLELLAAHLPESFRAAQGELRGQHGPDLWQRMEHCIEELCAEGNRPVVIRNTDSPELEVELVLRAIGECGEGRLVLGPDSGGGYYLLGLNEPCPGLFTGLDEGATTVFAATVRRAAEMGLDVVTLPERGDVDTFEDLLEMWRGRD